MVSMKAAMIDDDGQSVAIYEWTPAVDRQMNQGVLLIPAAPWEMMRLSWLYRKLALELSKIGFAVLCFDLPGTGNSSYLSSAIDWQSWLRCVSELSKHMRARVRRLHLVGTRLGGNLAWLEALSEPYRSIHLIDPVWQYETYLKSLSELQNSFLAEMQRYGQTVQTDGEIFGFSLAFISKISHPTWDLSQSRSKQVRIYQSALAQTSSTVPETMRHQGILTVKDQLSWLDANRMQHQAFCHDLLVKLIKQFEELP